MGVESIPVSQVALPKYVPKRKLRGIGGVYTVYEATQVGLNRPVELRVLNCKLQPGSGELLRFQHELSCLASLDHPSIIRVLDLGVMEEHVFYVTDLRNAKSLQELTDKGHSFSLEEALHLARSLASALVYLHRKNILHRDLNAASVFLDQETNVPYIAEFFMVKNLAVQSLTQRGIPTLRALIRTPEALAGQPYDGRTDVYMLGQLLYLLLTQEEPPLPDGARADKQDAVHPRAVNPRIPPEVDQLVVRALRERAEDRFQTADEMLAELERVIEKVEVKAVLSEIAETTLSEIKVVRPVRRVTNMDETIPEGFKATPRTVSPGTRPGKAAPDSRSREAKSKGKDAPAGTWLSAHKDYLYLAAAPSLLILVMVVLFSTRSESNDGYRQNKKVDRRVSSNRPPPRDDRDFGPDVGKVCEAVKRTATNKENFHQRWYLLDNWVKQLTAAQKSTPFASSDLVSIRITFYRDESEASQRLDALFSKAETVTGSKAH
jgi:serine/threonine protein kinase